MKKYSSKKCTKGKTGFRTPSVFKITSDRKNKFNKIKSKKRK
ncbi:MAG: hypothetical protein P1P85_03600 [Patescibacteria group bacterium]|nr:hypothetical protein [Patescibacteria group bacterium]